MRGAQEELYFEGYGKGVPDEDRIARVLRLASTLTADALLDIGCGDGSMALALKKACGSKAAFGIEVSPEGPSKPLRRAWIRGLGQSHEAF